MRGMGTAVLAVLACAVLVSAVLAALALPSSRSSINSYAGPFNIMFREATQCPEGTITGPLGGNFSGTLHHLRSAKYTVFDGHAQLMRDITVGDIGVKVVIAKWDNVAGWKDNFFRIDAGEVCNVLATIAKDAITEVSRLNPKLPKGCPFRKGTYILHNVSSEIVQRYEHFPVFPYGRFRGDVLYYDMKSKQIVACCRGVSDIVPKLKKS